MHESKVTFYAEDGYPLAGTLFLPRRSVSSAVVINSATGVLQQYYHAFARHLAIRGFAVLCYDYRGIGKSIPEDSRPGHLSMRAWGERDFTAAIDWLDCRFPEARLALVGHSVGGQLLGLARNNDRIDAAYCVASQSGYWRHWPLRLQPKMFALWYGAIPLALRLAGHLPRQLAGAELPADIAREWARWCTHPDFIVDEHGNALREGFERYQGALTMVHIEDDDQFAPKAAVQALASMYTGTIPRIQTLSPAEVGLPGIGHFGFFRRSMPEKHWDAVADWLLQAIPSTRAEAA